MAQEADKLIPAMVAEAARIAGLSFSEEDLGQKVDRMRRLSGGTQNTARLADCSL